MSRQAVKFALFFQYYLLPVFCLICAYDHFSAIRLEWTLQRIAPEIAAVRIGDWLGQFELFAQRGHMFVFNLLLGVCLLICGRPVVAPQRLRDVCLPVVSTFLPLLYNLLTLLPEWTGQTLNPSAWDPTLDLVGISLTLVGAALAMSSILCLGRSFGILIAFRRVVTRGPYHWIRHPIYLGYTIEMLGLCTANFTVATLALSALAFALLHWRARLEEQRLCQVSPEYRLLLARTGCFLPRWKSATSTASEDDDARTTPEEADLGELAVAG